ncbi:MAG: pyridoxamine 5'-phosphate oxidase [Myxococcota bacterium]|nr:pyridoxamine 5'-phosphate oxidase [Myxococcota bacterium]
MNHEEWADGNPFTHFQKLFAEASKSEAFDPTRAALATVDAKGQPSVRFVLVRGMYEDSFVFYTDYRSKKSKHLGENPLAALTWHWSSTGVQIRVEGKAERAEDAVSDEYFAGRHRGSQLGAWSSFQSQILSSRSELGESLAAHEAKFREKKVTRPPHWGGYRLRPTLIEFWFDRPDRLHDRFEYTFKDGKWRTVRLSP